MSHIYVMTHKKVNNIPDDGFYVPLHVGRALRDDLGYMDDAKGDSISEKNANYCELTGLYWLWKNGPSDVTGICHYRRYFVFDDALITREKVDEILDEYDIIIPESGRVHADTVYENYANIHHAGDLDTCREVISDLYPEYLKAFEMAMNSCYMTYANMLICRKEIFDSYCRWLFDILFEVEKRTDISTYDQYQARIYGFLSERLLRVWLFMQNIRVYECETLDIEPENFENDKKTIELREKLLKARLTELIELYKRGVLLNQTLIGDFSCQDDFDGKVPVWFTWWQGMDEMPEVVSLCYNSLKKNLPENATIRFITLQNVMEYVAFSDKVIERFNEGNITMTMLSDILRSELLYRYGGMWIDATYLVNRPISADFLAKKFEGGLYTLRFENPVFKADISRGRWSGNLWITRPGCALFKFMTEAFNYYFEMNDEPVDYYQIDYTISIAMELFPELFEELKECEPVSSDVITFVDEMNHAINDSRLEKLESNRFFKLTYRKDYKKQTLTGEETVYGVIFSKYMH